MLVRSRLLSLGLRGGACRPAARACSSSSNNGYTLDERMRQELYALFPSAAVGPAAPEVPEPKPRTRERKMPDHELPPYCEANFRKLAFIFTRAPRRADFPKEKIYTKEAIDMLYRHYYKNP